MKRKTVAGLITIVAIVAVVIFAGCVEEETPVYTPLPTDRDGGYTPTSQADLQIIDVRVDATKEANLDNYVIFLTVRNNGDESATGFIAGCKWECPERQATFVKTFVNSKLITDTIYGDSEATFTYTAWNSTYFTGVVRLDCWVDGADVIKESNESNNEWSGMVAIPNSGLPKYSGVLKTYPDSAELCTTDAYLNEVSEDGTWLLEAGHGGIQIVDFNLIVECYGTKITINTSSDVEIDGTTYKPGAKLTVNKDLQWIEVSSWG